MIVKRCGVACAQNNSKTPINEKCFEVTIFCCGEGLERMRYPEKGFYINCNGLIFEDWIKELVLLIVHSEWKQANKQTKTKKRQYTIRRMYSPTVFTHAVKVTKGFFLIGQRYCTLQRAMIINCKRVSLAFCLLVSDRDFSVVGS